jgi:translation initiation factor 2 subunit 1
MYLNKVPNVHEIVFAQLVNKRSGDMGNYVDLVEYNNIEGLVLCTEITKRKANLKSIIKQGEIFPVFVLNIGTVGIDLSYSKVNKQSIDLLKSCYEYQSRLYKLLNETCKSLKLSDEVTSTIIHSNIIQDVYTDCALCNKNIPKSLYENVLKNPSIIFENTKSIDNTIQKDFCDIVKEKITIKPYNVDREFKLCVFDNHSLFILKEILKKIKDININNYELGFQISCRSSPFYQIKVVGTNIDEIGKYLTELENEITNILNNYNAVVEFPDKYVIVKELEYILN